MKPKLSKALLAAVLATFSAMGSTVGAADSISINFYNNENNTITDQTGSLNGVEASGWNNISGSSGTHTYEVTNQSGTAAGHLVLTTPMNAWGAGEGSELEDVLAKGYLDLSNSTDGHYTVVLNSYFAQDVILYFSGDSGRFNSVNVNGKRYIGGVDQQVENPTAWGNRAAWSDNDHYYDPSTGNLNADKAIQVSNVAGLVTVSNDESTTNRATLAGMQVIDRTDEVAYTATLGSGSTAAADATWTKGGSTTDYANIDSADRLLLVTADAAGSTMTLASGDSIKGLAAKENALTVTSDGAVTVGSLYAYQGATLNFNADLQSNSSVNVSGKGAVNLGGALNNASLTNAGTLNITSANNSIASLTNIGGTLNINADGNNITNLTNDGTLTIAGTSAIGSLANAGTLNINADTTVSGVFSNTGTLAVADNKTLAVSSLGKNNGNNPTFIALFKDAGTGNVTINGNVDFCRESGNRADNPPTRYDQQTTNLKVTGNLAVNAWGATEWRVGEGKTLTVTGNATFQTKQTLVVNGGTVDIAGQLGVGHTASGNNDGHLVLESGKLTVKSINMQQPSGNDAVTMTGGTLEFTDGTVDSVITRANTNSTVSITGGTLKASQNSWTADLGEGGSAMSIGNVTIETGTDYTITLGHANLTGTITNNGNLALTNANLADGTVITNNGNLTLGTVTNSGTASLNGNITLSETITDNGSLDLTGAQVSIMSLDGFTRDESAAAAYTGGQVEGNGFEQSTYIIIAGSSTGNKSLEVSYNGSAHNLQDGKLMGQTYGTFHVNSGTESVSYIASAAPEGKDTTTISMAGGTVLTVDAALGNKAIAVNGAATADIGEKQSLSASSVTVANGASLTLTGKGNYVVTTANAASVGPTAHTHLKTGADGWEGTVTLSNHDNANNHTQNFSNLVNGEHSKLELNGFAGWGTDPTWYGTEATNFILTDKADGTVAWKNGAYSSTSEKTLNFTGSFSGDGTFHIDLTGNVKAKMHYTFSGNISDWKGEIRKSGHADATVGSTLTFDDKATNVNVAIKKEGGGVLNVVAGADGITFSKDIAATSLAVNANVNATLQGTTTVNTLETGAGSTLSGAVTVASTATINGIVKGGGIQWAAAEGAQNTLTLNTVYNVGNANVLTTMAAGSTINFGEAGQIVLGTTGQGNTGLAGKNLTLTATLTLNEVVAGNMVVTDTLWLIKGTDIYGREGENSLVNFDASSVTEGNGESLTRYALATSLDEAWTLPESTAELMRAATAPGVGAYRFVSTGDGIGIQYFQNVPEPATATLSLLALAALVARRRRNASCGH